MMMPVTYDNVIEQLITHVPEFEAAYKRHLEENDGELLSHPLFADLLRFTVDEYRLSTEPSISNSSSSNDVFRRVLNFVEDAAQSRDERVGELVRQSFLENLDQAGRDYEAIRVRLGPTSRKLLAETEEGWRPPSNA